MPGRAPVFFFLGCLILAISSSGAENQAEKIERICKRIEAEEDRCRAISDQLYECYFGRGPDASIWDCEPLRLRSVACDEQVDALKQDWGQVIEACRKARMRRVGNSKKPKKPKTQPQKKFVAHDNTGSLTEPNHPQQPSLGSKEGRLALGLSVLDAYFKERLERERVRKKREVSERASATGSSSSIAEPISPGGSPEDFEEAPGPFDDLVFPPHPDEKAPVLDEFEFVFPENWSSSKSRDSSHDSGHAEGAMEGLFGWVAGNPDDVGVVYDLDGDGRPDMLEVDNGDGHFTQTYDEDGDGRTDLWVVVTRTGDNEERSWGDRTSSQDLMVSREVAPAGTADPFAFHRDVAAYEDARHAAESSYIPDKEWQHLVTDYAFYQPMKEFLLGIPLSIVLKTPYKELDTLVSIGLDTQTVTSSFAAARAVWNRRLDRNRVAEFYRSREYYLDHGETPEDRADRVARYLHAMENITQAAHTLELRRP